MIFKILCLALLTSAVAMTNATTCFGHSWATCYLTCDPCREVDILSRSMEIVNPYLNFELFNKFENDS
jgi:hypothetical protein